MLTTCTEVVLSTAITQTASQEMGTVSAWVGHLGMNLSAIGIIMGRKYRQMQWCPSTDAFAYKG